MRIQSAITMLGALGTLGCLGSVTQAQVMVVGGSPYYGSTVVVGRPVVPTVPALPVAPVYSSAYVAPAYPVPAYSTGYAPSYSVGYAGYSTYSPVVQSYVAPATVVSTPVVTYRPAVVPAYPVYPAYRPGVVTTRSYYPGQPVRNALRVIAP